MKSLFLAAGITLLLLNGCGSDNNTIVAEDTQDAVAVTENLIALDPSLKVSAENIVVFNLEHHGATVDANDTATAGTDCYTYLHDEAMQTVLSVDTNNSIGSLYVTNKTTNETITVLSGEASVPFEFSANTDYEVCVTHNGMSAEMQTVFVRFTDTASVPVASSAIASTDAQPVGYKPGDLKKLLATKDCEGCDLSGANLGDAHLEFARLNHANLSGADLSAAIMSDASLDLADLSSANLNSAYLDSADLSSANLTYANLTHATLTWVNLTYANLNHADLSASNLSDADLSSADLNHANLHYSNLSNANLSASNLSDAYLISANLSGTDLSDADLSRATWTDGTICKEGSIGECKK